LPQDGGGDADGPGRERMRYGRWLEA